MATRAIDLPHARHLFEQANARAAALIASLPSLEVALPRSEWTVGDTAAHMAIALRAFSDSASGKEAVDPSIIPDTPRWSDRLRVVNEITVAAEPRRPPGEAGVAVSDGAARFLDATGGMSPTEIIPTPWYGNTVTHTVLTATCLMLGEQLVHGYDIATAVGRPWSISADEACVAFEGVRAMMPVIFDAEHNAGVRAAWALHVGRGSRFVVRVADGAVTVNPTGKKRVDCHIGGSPAALLMVGYGRMSQWKAIGRGRLVAWGVKPWLGFRFVQLFYNP